MTVKDIRTIIGENNKNTEIKWNVAKNTKSEIRLTNSYDKCVEFIIRVKEEDGDKYAKITEENAGIKAYYSIGDDRYDDFASEEEALRECVKSAVKMFYIYY